MGKIIGIFTESYVILTSMDAAIRKLLLLKVLYRVLINLDKYLIVLNIFLKSNMLLGLAKWRSNY